MSANTSLAASSAGTSMTVLGRPQADDDEEHDAADAATEPASAGAHRADTRPLTAPRDRPRGRRAAGPASTTASTRTAGRATARSPGTRVRITGRPPSHGSVGRRRGTALGNGRTQRHHRELRADAARRRSADHSGSSALVSASRVFFEQPPAEAIRFHEMTGQPERARPPNRTRWNSSIEAIAVGSRSAVVGKGEVLALHRVAPWPASRETADEVSLGDRISIDDHDGVDLGSRREHQVDRPSQCAALPGRRGIVTLQRRRRRSGDRLRRRCSCRRRRRRQLSRVVLV